MKVNITNLGLAILMISCNTNGSKKNESAIPAVDSLCPRVDSLNPMDDVYPYPDDELSIQNAEIGDSIRFEDSEWIIVSAYDNGNTLKSNNMFKDDASTDGKYITICYKVKNTTNKEVKTLETPKLIDSQGREYNEYENQTFYIPKDAEEFKYAPLPPSITKEFYSIFEVAADATDLKFQTFSFIENGGVILVNIGF